MTSPQIVTPGTADVIRRHQMSKGAAVVTSASLDAHLKAQFGPKVEVEVKPAPEVVRTIPFVLTADAPLKPVRKKATKTNPSPLNETPPAPTHLVEYMARLENGSVLAIPEYAHLVKKDEESLIMAFPITKKSRLKPDRGSELEIRTSTGKFLCFCTGIHTDIAEWGLSLSVYLVKETL